MKKALVLFVCIAFWGQLYAQKENQVKNPFQTRILKLVKPKSIDSVYQSLLKANPTPIVVVDGQITTIAILKPWNASVVESVEVLTKEQAIAVYGQAGAKGVVRFMLRRNDGALSTWAEESPKEQWKAKDTTVYNNSTPDILMPSYPGGPEKFAQFVKEKNIYPEAAKKNKIEGEVLLSFIVDKDGLITNVKIDKGLGHGLDEEAKRLIGLRRWNPAILKGHPVRASYSLPIAFKLN